MKWKWNEMKFARLCCSWQEPAPNGAIMKRYYLGRSSTQDTVVGNQRFRDSSESSDFFSSAFQLMPVVANSLCIIFNNSIGHEVFSDSWKIARVAPILKNGPAEERSNYRLKSVLPFISRLFEKLNYNLFYRYLNKNEFGYKHQSRFRSLHSMVICLLNNANKWYVHVGNKEYIGFLFLNLKKACHTVDNDILHKKLNHLCFGDLELVWFKSYLNNRRQCYNIENKVSSDEQKSHWGPQGSSLRPLFDYFSLPT